MECAYMMGRQISAQTQVEQHALPDKSPPSCFFPSSCVPGQKMTRSWVQGCAGGGESERPARPWYHNPSSPRLRGWAPHTHSHPFLCLQRTVSAFNNSNKAGACLQKMLFGASSLPCSLELFLAPWMLLGREDLTGKERRCRNKG